MLFHHLFQYHDQQHLVTVGTTETSPRSIFTNILAQMMTAANIVVYREANITPNQCVEFHVSLANTETAATTWSIADMDHVVNQLESGHYGIPLN